MLLGLQFAEQYAIGYFLRGFTFGQEVYTLNYTLTTVFLVVALFGYALSAPDWGKGTPLPALGEYAVGVYLLHVPVLYTLIQVGRLVGTTAGVDIVGTLPWHVAVTPVVYALALYLLAARVGLVEAGGSHTPRLRRIRSRFRSTGAVSPLSG